MAGSYSHVTEIVDGEPRFLGDKLIGSPGDMMETIEELWFIAVYLAGNDATILRNVSKKFCDPHEDSLAAHILNRMAESKEETE